MAAPRGLTVQTGDFDLPDADVTQFQGAELVENVEQSDVKRIRERLMKHKKSSYRGFESPNDAEYQSIESALSRGIPVTLLAKNVGVVTQAKGSVTFDKENARLTVVAENPSPARFDLPLDDLVSMCRGADGMISIHKSFKGSGDLPLTLALIFRRSALLDAQFNNGVASQLDLAVVDDFNVEVDLKLSSETETENCARFFETLLRDSALKALASRHVTYFPPSGPPNAVKLSKKLHRLRVAEHKLHQRTDPEGSKKEIERIAAARAKEIAEFGYPVLDAEFRSVLALLQRGVPFQVHYYNGAVNRFFSSREASGVLRYSATHVLHISEDVPPSLTPLACFPAMGQPGERVYSVAELQAVALGKPVPVRMMVNHVPADQHGRTVCLTFNLAEQLMTFGSEALAEKVVKFFNTVIWHREEQLLENSHVFLLSLRDKTEMDGGIESAQEALDAPAA